MSNISKHTAEVEELTRINQELEVEIQRLTVAITNYESKHQHLEEESEKEIQRLKNAIQELEQDKDLVLDSNISVYSKFDLNNLNFRMRLN